MNKKNLCILLCLCALFIITADASDSQLNIDGRKLVLHQEFEYDNGKLIHSTEHEYDSHGREIKTTYYGPSAHRKLYYDCEYAENNNMNTIHWVI